jgi:hypothetical protein
MYHVTGFYLQSVLPDYKVRVQSTNDIINRMSSLLTEQNCHCKAGISPTSGTVKEENSSR